MSCLRTGNKNSHAEQERTRGRAISSCNLPLPLRRGVPGPSGGIQARCARVCRAERTITRKYGIAHKLERDGAQEVVRALSRHRHPPPGARGNR
eukprot:scaffold2933_cov31-Tisochrysis_lutea.AAC.5